MPIQHRIDHERRLVLARGIGVLTYDEVFGYQREVWSDPEIAHYNELMDMTRVESIELESSAGVKELAAASAAMDPGGPERRFAIVAPNDFAFGLGRMYEAYREMLPGSRKRVGVFRTMPEALEFLAIRSRTDPWDAEQQ